MIDTYDTQICDHCGDEFTHNYFSGGTRFCATCEVAHRATREPFGEVAEMAPEDDWFTEETFTVNDFEAYRVGT